MIMKRTLLSLSLLSLAHTGLAEEAKKLSTDIELGVVSTQGNTETSSLKANVNVKQDLEKFRNHFVLSGLYKEDTITVTDGDETTREDQTTAEKYFASLQTDFKLNQDHRGLFVFGSYEEDKFSGFEYQGTLAFGYSDRIFKFDNSHLNYSIGPGMSFSKTEAILDSDGNVETESESESVGIVRISLDFLYQISENSKFTQTFSTDAAMSQGDNSKTQAETAITANVMTGLALKASYVIDHNTHPPADTKNADTTTSITFVLSF